VHVNTQLDNLFHQIILFGWQGFLVFTLSALILSSSCAPAPFITDPYTAAALSAAGLTLTTASGVAVNLPVASLLLAKGVALKAALLAALAEEEGLINLPFKK